MARHTEEPFSRAPFVHPFRFPLYHAQQLGVISFARAQNKRLLWIAAHDVPRKDATTDEQRKERWLEFHDLFTSGIPGLFLAVLDLPVRFTDRAAWTRPGDGRLQKRTWLLARVGLT